MYNSRGTCRRAILPSYLVACSAEINPARWRHNRFEPFLRFRVRWQPPHPGGCSRQCGRVSPSCWPSLRWFCSWRWCLTRPAIRAGRIPATANPCATRWGRLAHCWRISCSSCSAVRPSCCPSCCWWPAFLVFRNRAEQFQPASRLNVSIRVGGFLMLLAASCGLAALHWQAGTLRESAVACWDSSSAGGLAGAMKLLGATLLLLAAWMAGLAIAFHVSWINVIDQLGAGFWRGIEWCRNAGARAAKWPRDRNASANAQQVQAAKQEQKKAVPRVIPIIEQPAPVVEKSDRAQKERQVTLFDPPKAGELPAMQLLDDPPERVASIRRGARSDVAAGGNQAARFRRRSGSGRRASRPGGHAFRDAAFPWHQGPARSPALPRTWPARCRHFRARGGSHPRQIGDGLEIPNEKREMVTLGEIIKSQGL